MNIESCSRKSEEEEGRRRRRRRRCLGRGRAALGALNLLAKLD